MKEFQEEYEEMDGLGIGVGDFITVKGMEGFLYVVADVYDYSDDYSDDGDILYNAIRIFPIRQNQQLEYEFSYTDVILHSKLNSKQYLATYEVIKRYRVERKLKAEPQIMEMFNIVDRDVDYSSGETINDCLDMMNNLDLLYETFGDKEYKDNKELVMKRLEELAKEDKKKKK